MTPQFDDQPMRAEVRDTLTELRDALPEVRDAPTEARDALPKLGTPLPKFGTPLPKFGTLLPKFGTPLPTFGTIVPKRGTLVPKPEAGALQDDAQFSGIPTLVFQCPLRHKILQRTFSGRFHACAHAAFQSRRPFQTTGVSNPTEPRGKLEKYSSLF